MRRGFIFFVSILALALVPAMACAQYSGAFGLSGLPSMPSLFGGSGNCGGGRQVSRLRAGTLCWLGDSSKPQHKRVAYGSRSGCSHY